jgi:4-diphosphocytidyl-2-C-methyl-D-erythritol kinase
MIITKLSPAKVNLYLDVIRKRQDGYHDIATLMQRISLCDEMSFSPSDHGIVIKCPDSSLPENEQNLVYKAAKYLFSEASYPSGIKITIRKNIPIAAGLGGGSSNAATTLLTLNDMLNFHYTKDDLMKLGAKLGADVPFFIFERTAWAFGIGDQIQGVENIPACWFVLINPGFEVSTKVVYENLNLRLTKGSINYSIPPLEGLSARDLAKMLYNKLETVTLSLKPVLADFKKLLIKNGALGALISGSGPTVFGVFDQEDGSIKAEEALKRMGIGSVFRAKSI